MRFIPLCLAAAAAVFVAACNQHDVPDTEKTAINVVAGVVRMRADYANTAVLLEKAYMDVDLSDELYDYKLTEMVKDSVGQSYHTSDGSSLLWTGSDRNPAVKALALPFGLYSVDLLRSMKVAVNAGQSIANAVKGSDLLGADSDELGGTSMEYNFRTKMRGASWKSTYLNNGRIYTDIEFAHYCDFLTNHTPSGSGNMF